MSALIIALLLAAGPEALLKARCVSCHGAEKQKGSLRLDSRAAMLKGGESGPAVILGQPEKSLLVQAVRHAAGDLKMPPKERLAADEIESLARWIKEGAPWPETIAISNSARVGDAWSDPRNPIVRIFQGKRLDLWSLKKVARPGASSIDELIQASLAKAGLALSPEADLRTLIRRVTFDLTGLPPTPEELEEKDYVTVVDRLLASPRYGERWARHLMDVIRYSDTQGFERDELQPLVWRYRDYLIRAFNADKPFDQFVKEQLAGDEMVSGPPKNQAEVDRLIATGYLRLGPYDSTGSIFEENAKNRNELMTDLANTTGSAFLGLTMSCCNCHDHKFDPISQADHFRLRAFFAGVKRQDDTPIDLAPVQEEIKAHNAVIDARLKDLEYERAGALENGLATDPKKLSGEAKERYDEVQKKIDHEKSARREFTQAMTMRESGSRPATHLFYQGDFTQPREVVEAGFLSALDDRRPGVERGEESGLDLLPLRFEVALQEDVSVEIGRASCRERV